MMIKTTSDLFSYSIPVHCVHETEQTFASSLGLREEPTEQALKMKNLRGNSSVSLRMRDKSSEEDDANLSMESCVSKEWGIVVGQWLVTLKSKTYGD